MKWSWTRRTEFFFSTLKWPLSFFCSIETETLISSSPSRISVDHSPNGPSTRLHLNNLQVSDDGVYLCESTFIEPLDTCNNLAVYNIDVKVLGRFLSFFPSFIYSFDLQWFRYSGIIGPGIYSLATDGIRPENEIRIIHGWRWRNVSVRQSQSWSQSNNIWFLFFFSCSATICNINIR